MKRKIGFVEIALGIILIVVATLIETGAFIGGISGTLITLIPCIYVAAACGVLGRKKFGSILAIILASLAALSAILFLVVGWVKTDFTNHAMVQDYATTIIAALGTLIFDAAIILLSCISYKKISRQALNQ